jgi:hypothetical protein
MLAGGQDSGKISVLPREPRARRRRRQRWVDRANGEESEAQLISDDAAINLAQH